MEETARILVIDDDPAIRLALKGLLTSDGYQVVTVESGEAGLELARESHFDLALIDLKLLGIGGIQVLAALRQIAPDTVAIILTAHASLETAVEAIHHGAHDYLFKPCTPAELRESVRAGLAKSRRPLATVPPLSALVPDPSSGPSTATAAEPGRFQRYGSLIIDTARHVVTVDGHLVDLSPTEFSLLAYLVKEAPRVVSSQELVQKVQGYESTPWEARDIIRFHIHRLRQKLAAESSDADLIVTVRGVGYRLLG